MAGGRKREQVLEIIDHVEQLMLQGITNPAQVARMSKDFALGNLEARHYMEHVRNRWARDASKQDRPSNRARAINMHMSALRRAYGLMAEANQRNDLANANRALGTIRALLSQIADLEGTKERTVRVGGDREQIPIRIEEQREEVSRLEMLILSGQLGPDQLTALKQNVIGAGNSPGANGPGNLRLVDAGTHSLPASQGDYPSGSDEIEG